MLKVWMNLLIKISLCMLLFIFMSVKGDWVSQYGHLTIEQLKNTNFRGQGQI